MSGELTIALGQVPIVMGDKAANRAALLAAVERAGEARCDLIVLPECGLAGWLSRQASAAAEPIPGPFVDELSAAARKHRIAVVAGMEERDGGRIYNSAVFIDETGIARTRHRKINELEFARSMYAAGASLEVIEWRGQRVGMVICADCWRPELVEALWAMGARLILSPCAWAVEPGGEATNLAWIAEMYRQRIHGRALTIAAANGVGEVAEGPWKGRILQGNSLAISSQSMACGPANRPDVVCFSYTSASA